MNGFLGNRASLMLDVVFLAMFVIVPVLGWSIYLVRVKRKYQLHKRIQMGLALLLLFAVTLFELEMRFFGWRHRAEASPYYDSDLSVGLVNWTLWVHLLFAISTFLLWTYVVVQAMRKSPMPPADVDVVRKHRFWGKLAAVDMGLTAVTGCTFYYLAFVA